VWPCGRDRRRLEGVEEVACWQCVVNSDRLCIDEVKGCEVKAFED
jgi:hypothetical protein